MKESAKGFSFVDPSKANQMVRGVVSLPHGTGKSVRVLALVTPDKVEEAKAAGPAKRSLYAPELLVVLDQYR